MPIDQLLTQASRQVPERIAILQGDRHLTYAAADEMVNRIANGLLGLDLQPGAKIAIMSTSRLEYPLVYFAAARAGLVSVHLSTRATTEDVVFMLNKVHADALVFEPKYAAAVAIAADRVPSLRHLFELDGMPTSDVSGPAGRVRLSDLIAGASPQRPAVRVRNDAPLAITFTGGTTGFPKGVVATHRARLATVASAAADFGIESEDVVIASTPLFHAAGLYVWFTTAILLGTTVVLQRIWDPLDFIEQVEAHRVTAAFLVPSQIHDLISHPAFRAERLASLKKLGYAGAPMGSSLFSRVREALPGVEFTENYGQSETCPITVRRPEHPPDKLGSVGRAARDVEIRIVDRDGEPAASGQIGEILVRAVHNFLEYFDDPEQTAAAFKTGDGWLWTGDLGYLDEDGFLTLVDRSKDMLVSGGENVYPAEIENAIYQHDTVAECAVFGIPDDRAGEVPAAYVVLRRGESLSEEQLTGFLEGRIARHKIPRLIHFVDSLPRTPVGKIRKADLRRPYWKGRRRAI